MILDSKTCLWTELALKAKISADTKGEKRQPRNAAKDQAFEPHESGYTFGASSSQPCPVDRFGESKRFMFAGNFYRDVVGLSSYQAPSTIQLYPFLYELEQV